MIASNSDKIQNHFLIEELEKLVVMEIVPKEQLSKIIQSNPDTKTNSNILIRIGFFLLGNFLISSLFGVFALLFAVIESLDVYGFLSLMAAGGCVFAAEYFRRQNYFSFGFDDSIILTISLCTCLGIGILSENIFATLILSVLMTSFCSARYVHVPSAFFALISLVGLAGYSIIEGNTIPSAYLPVFMFLISILLYFFQNKISKNTSNFIYKNVFLTIKIFSLILAYISLNYFVVRELSEILLDFNIAPNEEIPLSNLFYFATFAIPMFYIFFGFKQKDRVFLWLGFITFALGFPTIRYYHHFFPVEIVLLSGGSLLFIIVYSAIRLTRNKTTGITFNEDKNLNPMAFDLIKNILINANTNPAITTNQESPMEFGGGGFSGGGSGSDF